MLKQVIQPYLTLQERLLWIDKPQPGMQFAKADWFLIPFDVFFTCFAFFWMAMAATITEEGGFPFFTLLGIPFVMMGLYMLFGWHFLDFIKRSKTVYAITSERTLILNQRSGLVHAYPLDQLKNITFTQQADDSGNLFLGSIDPHYQMLQGTSWPGVKLSPTFQKIAGIQHVYTVLKEAKSNLKHENWCNDLVLLRSLINQRNINFYLLVKILQWKRCKVAFF